MSHHEQKKADEPKPQAADENPTDDDTEGHSRSFHHAIPTEPTDKTDKNPTGDDTNAD